MCRISCTHSPTGQNKTNYLKIGQWNVNGLKRKLNNLDFMSEINDYICFNGNVVDYKCEYNKFHIIFY